MMHAIGTALPVKSMDCVYFPSVIAYGEFFFCI